MKSAVPTALDLEAYGLDPAWSHFVDVRSHDGGTHRWHVLDRPGSGPTTVLCLHGNPTWSYLWSRLMRELDPAIRVIAPDHLGMGWSERVGTRPYRDRVADLGDLLATLDVTGPVWIVAQDWGGAIAMGVAVHRPELVAGLVLSNTGIAVPAGRSAPWLIRLAAANGVHRLATRTTPAFVWGTPWLPGAHVARRERRALAAPYHGASRRDAIAGFVADVPFDDRHSSAADLAAVADALPGLTIPVRLVWGSKDPVFNDDFAEDLRGRFADVALHRIAATGHLTVLETSIAPFVEDAITATATSVVGNAVEPLGPRDGIDEIWSRIAGGDPSAIAVSDAASGDLVTRREFESLVASYAVALAAKGVRAGDRVAVLVPPGVDLIAVVYACWRIGAVTVVADRGLGLRGLGAAVRSARVRHVVGPAKAIAAVRTLRWAPGASTVSLSTLHDAPKVAALADVAVPSPAGSDPAAVVFTSGATGPAKGVRYTFGQLCAQRDAVQALYGITPDDRFVAAFAPFAVFGPALGIATGFADMDVTSPSTLTATALDDACRRIDATMVFASPAALANVLATASSPTPALAAVRLVMSAGAPVPIDTLRRMSVLCPSAALHTPYGMTEVLPVADVSLVDRIAATDGSDGRGVCVGRPVPGCEVMILAVDGAASGSPLPAGVTGEVVVRTPWMSSGYDRLWRTEQSARPVIDGAVWHRTGDVGHLHASGDLWIEGRVVHLIHTLDGAVSPVPIEVAAEAVPGVRRAAAVGVGPVGVQQVVVVLEDGREAQAATELAAAVRAAVAPQVVAAVWCSPLPVDIRHNAKIDRTALAATMERLLSGRSR